MDGMMRQMDHAARSAGAAAARGALPDGCHYVSHSSTYDSSGARTSATTRAAGGVRESQHWAEDGSGQQRCTVARAIGDRVSRIAAAKGLAAAPGLAAAQGRNARPPGLRTHT
jgi:hypothetical protein